LLSEISLSLLLLTRRILLNFLSLKSENSKDKLLSNIKRIFPSVISGFKKSFFDIEYILLLILGFALSLSLIFS